jgi:hypothetical protein
MRAWLACLPSRPKPIASPKRVFRQIDNIDTLMTLNLLTRQTVCNFFFDKTDSCGSNTNGEFSVPPPRTESISHGNVTRL